MGRPPIGKHAMSAAERQRRHRAQAKPVTKSVTKPITAQANAEIAALKVRIAELEALATKQQPSDAPDARMAELKAALDRAQAERNEFGRRYWEMTFI
jgi:hypothetical protein